MKCHLIHSSVVQHLPNMHKPPGSSPSTGEGKKGNVICNKCSQHTLRDVHQKTKTYMMGSLESSKREVEIWKLKEPPRPRPTKSLEKVAARVRDPVKSNLGQSRNTRKKVRNLSSKREWNTLEEKGYHQKGKQKIKQRTLGIFGLHEWIIIYIKRRLGGGAR